METAISAARLGKKGEWITHNHRMVQIKSVRKKGKWEWEHELVSATPQFHIHHFDSRGWCQCGIGQEQQEAEGDE